MPFCCCLWVVAVACLPLPVFLFVIPQGSAVAFAVACSPLPTDPSGCPIHGAASPRHGWEGKTFPSQYPLLPLLLFLAVLSSKSQPPRTTEGHPFTGATEKPSRGDPHSAEGRSAAQRAERHRYRLCFCRCRCLFLPFPQQNRLSSP